MTSDTIPARTAPKTTAATPPEMPPEVDPKTPLKTGEEAPVLSVVIPSVNSYDDLDGCLAALGAQGLPLEVIVVDRLGEHVRHWVRKGHPGCVVIAVPGDATIPRMRALGIRRAGAPAVAVIEDHVIVPEGWARAMLDALGDGSQVVGGPVDNAATDTLVDWAAFLCEYSSTLPPLPEGKADWLPGNNVIYPTRLLRQFDAVLDEGKWENRLHDAIRDGGTTLTMHNANVAGHKMHYTFGLYMSQRYLYSRSYAGAKRDGMGTGKRIVMGFASLGALPPLMFWRTISRIRAKNRYPRELRRSLPLLVPFCLSWGAGEAMGYWFGPGRSLSRVR